MSAQDSPKHLPTLPALPSLPADPSPETTEYHPSPTFNSHHPQFTSPPPTPPNPRLYTPSLPCLHCTLLSSRCSLQNSINHCKPRPPPPNEIMWIQSREKCIIDGFRDGNWEMHRDDSQHPNESVRGLEGRCKRCVRDGVWCVLRQESGQIEDDEGLEDVWGMDDDDEDKVGDLSTLEAGRWVEDGIGRWVKIGRERKSAGGGMKAGMGEKLESRECDDGGHREKDDQEDSTGSIGGSRQRRRVEASDESSDEDANGPINMTSFSASRGRKFTSTKSGKSTKFSENSSVLPQENRASFDIVHNGVDSDEDDNNSDTNSNSDLDADDSDTDVKSNVSSKTSFSRRSIKSSSSIPSSPIINNPPSLPPPPQPPEHHAKLPDDSSRQWNQIGCIGNNPKPKRKPFNRGNHTSNPLSAAITAVEVTKSDIRNLIPDSKKSGGGVKQFLFSKLDLPFIAYTRCPGLSPGQEGQEQLVEIIRSQISDALSSSKYEERIEHRKKKEGLGLVEGGILPLEFRLGNSFLTTQEDLQKRFALPSWQTTTKGLEDFLGEGMVVEMRSTGRKEMEKIRRRQNRLEQEKENEEIVRGWMMEVEGQEGKENDEGEDEGSPILKGLESLTLDNLSKPKPQPLDLRPASEPEPEPDILKEAPSSIPSSQYFFSLRRSRLHHFWTNEAQPIDFELARLARTNTLRKWRGEKLVKLERFKNANLMKTFLCHHQTKPDDGAEGVVVNNSVATGSIDDDDDDDDWLDTLDRGNTQSVVDEPGEQHQQLLHEPIDDIPAAAVATETTEDGKEALLTQQGLADTGHIPFTSASPYPPSEPEWRFVADDMAMLSDADDDEDILRFLGDNNDSDDKDDVEGHDGDEGESGNDGRKENVIGNEDGDEPDDLDDRDSHPLIDYFREVNDD